LRADTLRIVATLPRADVRDRLIGAASIAALPQGARVGTSSPRRAAQLLCRRPDLRIQPFRGNVETRLRKIGAGEADATLLAAAGLERLGRHDVGVPLDDFLPAPAQGAVGIEVRAEDETTARLVEAIDHADTYACILAERCFLEGLSGDCHSPISALAVMEGEHIYLRGQIMAQDGSELRRGETRFAPGDAEEPKKLARHLLDQASRALRALFAA
jgi:hydroxymethylbilane synthase